MGVGYSHLRARHEPPDRVWFHPVGGGGGGVLLYMAYTGMCC